MRLADETIDGLWFGWALEAKLARDPAAQARHDVYDEGLRADRPLWMAALGLTSHA